MTFDWKQAFKYAVVGISGVAVNTGFLYTLTEYFGVWYIISAAIASELSIINNFIWNNKWTFSNAGSKYNVWIRFLIYNGISIIGTCLLIMSTYILTEYFGIYYIFSDWISMAGVFGINYLLNKNITWSGK